MCLQELSLILLPFGMIVGGVIGGYVETRLKTNFPFSALSVALPSA